jgi:hypothetical protein
MQRHGGGCVDKHPVKRIIVTSIYQPNKYVDYNRNGYNAYNVHVKWMRLGMQSPIMCSFWNMTL